MAKFDNTDNERCPRSTFIEDLVKKVKQGQEQGNQIVLIMDENEDIGMGEVCMALQSLPLEEAIIGRWGRWPPDM